MTARSIARSVARSAAKTVIGSGASGGGGPAYDADAQDYFTRAEALGGSFDQSGLGYSESVVKTAISDFVAGCKTDSIWTKIIEAYLLAGVTFSGVLAKLKHAGTAAITNVNFVSGDYLAAGSGAGLVGNGTTKHLNLTVADNTIGVDSRSWSTYVTGLGTNNKYWMGVSGGAADNHWSLIYITTLYGYAPSSGASQIVAKSPTVTTGYPIASRRANNAQECYWNGTSSATGSTLVTGAATANNWRLFDINNNGASAGPTDARFSFAHIGSGLTDTDAANLSTRVNALMTALGANVY